MKRLFLRLFNPMLKWFNRNKTAVLIFVVFMGIYHANGRPICEQDCIPAPYTAWSLVKYATFDVHYYPKLEKYLNGAIRETAGGKWISCYPPGSAIAAVPFVAPYAVFRSNVGSSGTMRYLGKITASTYVALSAVLIYLICLNLFPAVALPTTILYGLGTCLWSVASQGLWMHGPATFFICFALYFLLTRPMTVAIALLTGSALGMAILTRPPLALFAAATCCALLLTRQWRAFVIVAATVTVFTALFIVYNRIYLDTEIASGYANLQESWLTPWWIGFFGLLVAPSRGLFIYSPALLLAPVGLYVGWKLGLPVNKTAGASIVSWAAATIGTVLLYGKWNCWWGALCFGPRFLCESLPIMCVLFAIAFGQIRHTVLKQGIMVLIALSVSIHFAGVFGSDNDWNSNYELGKYAQNLFSPRETQIGAHVKTLAGNVYNTAAKLGLNAFARNEDEPVNDRWFNGYRRNFPALSNISH